MRSQRPGAGTSEVEALNITQHGVWLHIRGEEFFLPYGDFPWFKDATVSQIHNVQLRHGHYLHWEDLDVDLELESLKHPDRYPLQYH